MSKNGDSSDSEDDIPSWGAKDGTVVSAKRRNDSNQDSVKKYSSKEKEFEDKLHDSTDPTHEERLQREIETMAEDNSALQAALTEALNQISILESQIEGQSNHPSGELKEALDEISVLQGKLSLKESMEDTLMMDNSASQAALDDALKKITELEKKLSRKESAADLDSSAAQTALKMAQSKISELEDSLSRSVFLANENRTQKDTVTKERDSLTSELDALARDKEQLMRKIAAMEKDMEAKAKEIEQQQRKLATDNQDLIESQVKSAQPRTAGGAGREKEKSKPVTKPTTRNGSRLGAPSREPRERSALERKPGIPKQSGHKADLIHIGRHEKHRRGRQQPHYLTTTNEVEMHNEGKKHIAPHMRMKEDHTSAPAHALRGAPEATHDFAFTRHLDHVGTRVGVIRRPSPNTSIVSKRRPFLGSPSRRPMPSRPSSSSSHSTSATRYRSRSVPDSRGRTVTTRSQQPPKRRKNVPAVAPPLSTTADYMGSSDDEAVPSWAQDDDEAVPSWAGQPKGDRMKKRSRKAPLPPSVSLDDSQLSAASVLAERKMDKATLLHTGVPSNTSEEDISFSFTTTTTTTKKVVKRAYSVSRSPPRPDRRPHATMGTPSRRPARSYSASPARALNGMLSLRRPFQRPFVAKRSCTFGSGR